MGAAAAAATEAAPAIRVRRERDLCVHREGSSGRTALRKVRRLFSILCAGPGGTIVPMKFRAGWGRRWLAPTAVAALALLLASLLPAQFWRPVPARYPEEGRQYLEGFVFCRGQYRQVVDEWLGQGWFTDYPDSEYNFMTRLSQLTTVEIQRTAYGDPEHLVPDPGRSAAVRVPVPVHVGCRHDRHQRRRSGEPEAVPAGWRLSLRRRLLGSRRLASLGQPDRPGAASRATTRSSTSRRRTRSSGPSSPSTRCRRSRRSNTGT